jgi:hypothetical protein
MKRRFEYNGIVILSANVRGFLMVNENHDV